MEGERRERSQGGDDPNDDFMEKYEEEGWAGIGTRLRIAGKPQESDGDGNGSEHTDPEQEEAGAGVW